MRLYYLCLIYNFFKLKNLLFTPLNGSQQNCAESTATSGLPHPTPVSTPWEGFIPRSYWVYSIGVRTHRVACIRVIKCRWGHTLKVLHILLIHSFLSLATTTTSLVAVSVVLSFPEWQDSCSVQTFQIGFLHSSVRWSFRHDLWDLIAYFCVVVTQYSIFWTGHDLSTKRHYDS